MCFVSNCLFKKFSNMIKITSHFSAFKIIFLGFLLIFSAHCFGQTKHKMTKDERKKMLRDTLDGRLDLSAMIDNTKGLIPVPLIVTEAALGGFGVALAPVYISPQEKPVGDKDYIAPAITGAFGMYTANDSWMVGLYRREVIAKYGLKYKVFLGYIDYNLSYYKEVENMDDQKFDFNYKTLPILLSLSKKTFSHLYLGAEYFRSKMTINPNFDYELPPNITTDDFDKTVASLSGFLDWDRRNTYFTPDNGYRINLSYTVNDDWTGSDYKFEKLETFVHYFFPITNKWISGLRFEALQSYGNVPFHQLPSIKLRGITAYRYQGQATLVTETEQRFDFGTRWSVLAYGGLGKVFQKDENFADAKTVYNYGTGFRYLVARTYGLRAGIDVAKGPDSWGYYIVFGHKWNR
jgi:hypothetical protein